MEGIVHFNAIPTSNIHLDYVIWGNVCCAIQEVHRVRYTQELLKYCKGKLTEEYYKLLIDAISFRVKPE